MPTNEQRAHDLAIALLDTVMQARVSESVRVKATQVEIDIYTEYKRLYEMILESVNRDFPD